MTGNATTSPTSTLSDLLRAATLPTVPAGVAQYLADELGYFALKNRNRRTVVMTDALVPFILVNRPGDLELPAEDQPEAAAKEFAYQIREFASERGLTTYPKRVGCTVTFRITKPSADNGNRNGEVTVSHIGDEDEDDE